MIPNIVFHLTTHYVGEHSGSIKLIYLVDLDYWRKNRSLSDRKVELPLDVQYYLGIGARITNNLYEVKDHSVTDAQCIKAGLIKDEEFDKFIESHPIIKTT